MNQGLLSRLLVTATTKMVKARKWVKACAIDGPIKGSDFKIVEEELPPLKDGGKQLVVIYPEK